jgi:hypothetical protein
MEVGRWKFEDRSLKTEVSIERKIHTLNECQIQSARYRETSVFRLPSTIFDLPSFSRIHS